MNDDPALAALEAEADRTLGRALAAAERAPDAEFRVALKAATGAHYAYMQALEAADTQADKPEPEATA